MLFDDPDDMHLSPLYDVVNTQIYSPVDTLALSLGKSKSFPERKQLIDFGKAIGVKKCEAIVDEMADQIRDELDVLTDYTKMMALDIKSSILENIRRSTTRTAIKTRAPRRHTKYS